MRRTIGLLTVAATMGAMVLLTASVVVADHAGYNDLVPFCEHHDGEMSLGDGHGGPTCTYTETTAAVAPAQHGFTLTKSQVFRINVAEFHAHEGPTPVGEPIVSCQDPQGTDVRMDDPNCTPTS